jgi:formylglycine-generating enzyme required for sulfatase activity
MAANMWEWTRSLWGTKGLNPLFMYPYDPGDGREDLEAWRNARRVLRGGILRDGSEATRCAARLWNFPGYSFSGGFRVCVVSQQD